MKFIDLKKAFDTIDHAILIEKLRFYGIVNEASDWIKSYLSNRLQRVLTNGVKSQYCSISHGMPQGSCLGPTLFIMYINDLTRIMDSQSVMLYADDTIVYMSGKNINDIQCELQKILDITVHWEIMNKLTINTSKTKSIIFNRLPVNQRPKIDLGIKDQILQQVSEYNTLVSSLTTN